MSQREQCKCTQNLQNFDSCHISLQWVSDCYPNTKLDDLKSDYEKLLNTQLPDQRQWQIMQEKQIERDLMRTFPDEPFFRTEYGRSALKRLLYTVAIYDIRVGYVQGMNFLLGALLYHSSEYIAFWNYVTLYERMELRDIFLENLPGLQKHIQIISLLMMSNHNQIYEKLLRNQIQIAHFCTPFFLSMFAMVFPLNHYHLIFSLLIKRGWFYFYQVLMSHIQTLNLENLDGSELMVLLMSQTRNGEEDRQKWLQVAQHAIQYKISEAQINQLLNSYDEEKQTFLLKKQS